MISAVSSSNATALLALFGRNTSNATANPTQTTAPRAPAPPPPLPQGSGATAQSLFDALVRGADGGPADANAPSLDDLLSNLMTGLDTDGDGKLSTAELKSAFATLTGDAPDPSSQTQTTGTGPAKSLYESMFNAMAADDGGPASTARKDNLAQKFLSLLEA